MHGFKNIATCSLWLPCAECCTLLLGKVAPSGYYDSVDREPSKRA